MLQEEIARLTGKLVFQVDNRPLATFEKKLGGVLNMLKELQGLANKKFTVKVALDSRSLRAQIDKATKTKITLSNVDISNEALHTQAKRIQDFLNKTTINLNNVKVDIGKLVEQKRFIRTLIGQMDIKIPVSLDLMKLERELRNELNAVGKRQKITVEAHVNTTQFIIKLRRQLKHAQNSLGALKIRIADPQVRLQVDKQHLIAEIQAAIASHEFRIRINARDQDFGGAGGRGGRGGGGGRGQVDRGLSAAMGFARGALPGLGAAFAFSEMNQINQQVQAANNSLHAVSGDEQKFQSNKTFLENMGKEMGLNFRDLAPQFTSILQAAAPSIGTGGTQDMFRGIMKFGTVHGLDKESMKGSMRALSQMFGKDKIQSEEARQQFAERMPGGMRLLAEAAQKAGISKTGTVAEFEDIMKKGKGDPTKILPELAKLMEGLADANDAYAKSLNTTRVAQGRMNNAFEQTVVIFSKGGFDRGMASFFNSLSDSMERAKPLTEALGGAFEILIKPVNALIRLVGHLGEAWPKIAQAFGMSEKALATLATAIGIFMLPFGGFIVALGAAALALDDFLTYLKGGESVFGDFVKETPGAQEAVDGFSQSMDHLKESLSGLGEAWDIMSEKFKGAFNIELENPLVIVIRTISNYVDNIARGLDSIAAIMRGDWKDGLKQLGQTAYDASQQHPLMMIRNKVMNTAADGVGYAAEGIGNWAKGGWRGSSMPTPAPLAPTGAPAGPNVNAPINLTLNVKAPEGTTDPKVFGDQLGLHVEELLNKSMRNMIGSYRANTAERQ